MSQAELGPKGACRQADKKRLAKPGKGGQQKSGAEPARIGAQKIKERQSEIPKKAA